MSTHDDIFDPNDLTFAENTSLPKDNRKRLESALSAAMPKKIQAKKKKKHPRLDKSSVILTQFQKVRRRSSALSTEFERQQEIEGPTKCTVTDFCLLLILFGAIAVGGVFIYQSFQPTGELLVLPQEVRSNSNYIGLYFLEETSDEAFTAFVEAAERWGDIVAGSEQLLPVSSEEFACGFQFSPPIALDHLSILVDVSEIDGEDGVLGSAGPCAFSNNIPTIGIMNFDVADFETLTQFDTLKSVVLHEMAHVLGIGTLWDRFGFISNALPDSLPNAELEKPFYSGPLAAQEFRTILGSQDAVLGIEDGFTGEDLNGAGPGAINGHFDEESLGSELMTFRIKVGDPPISTVTIRSLQDFGYSVDVGQADFFQAVGVGKTVVDSDEQKMEIVMLNDIIDPTPFLD